VDRDLNLASPEDKTRVHPVLEMLLVAQLVKFLVFYGAEGSLPCSRYPYRTIPSFVVVPNVCQPDATLCRFRRVPETSLACCIASANCGAVLPLMLARHQKQLIADAAALFVFPVSEGGFMRG
jgi:hypothetical protein